MKEIWKYEINRQKTLQKNSKIDEIKNKNLTQTEKQLILIMNFCVVF